MTRSVEQINAELRRLRKVKATFARTEIQDVVYEIGMLSLQRREASLVDERRALREQERARGLHAPGRMKRSVRRSDRSSSEAAPLPIAAKGS